MHSHSLSALGCSAVMAVVFSKAVLDFETNLGECAPVS